MAACQQSKLASQKNKLVGPERITGDCKPVTEKAVLQAGNLAAIPKIDMFFKGFFPVFVRVDFVLLVSLSTGLTSTQLPRTWPGGSVARAVST